MDSLRQDLRSFLKLRSAYRPSHIRTVERTEDDGLIRTRLRYMTEDRDLVEAFLFEPAGVKSSGAVLALHQHNSQWEIGKSEIAGLAGDPLQAFGPALARRGVTVLAPDAIGFESRMKSAGWGSSLAPALNRPAIKELYFDRKSYGPRMAGLLFRALDQCRGKGPFCRCVEC